MRSNGNHARLLQGLAVCALALFTTLTSETALAAATPGTTAYQFSSHPMISGTVVTVNDREMIVNTDQGEQLTLEIDSRTMAPRDLAPGMVMRAEFVALDDCRLYAQRIVPVRGGMSTQRLQAYANTRDSREVIERNASAEGSAATVPAVAAARVTATQTVGAHSAGAIMQAVPASADYVVSTRPQVSGRVVTVNDHWLVIQTDQGQQVGMVMDSRTLVPRAVAPGTFVRADFTQMHDGRYYTRSVRTQTNVVADREQAYAHTRDSDLVVSSSVSDCGARAVPAGNTTSSVEPRDPAPKPAPVVDRMVPEPPATLPQTASDQPLTLLLGVFALGAAGVIAVARRVRVV